MTQHPTRNYVLDAAVRDIKALEQKMAELKGTVDKMLLQNTEALNKQTITFLNEIHVLDKKMVRVTTYQTVMIFLGVIALKLFLKAL